MQPIKALLAAERLYGSSNPIRRSLCKVLAALLYSLQYTVCMLYTIWDSQCRKVKALKAVICSTTVWFSGSSASSRRHTTESGRWWSECELWGFVQLNPSDRSQRHWVFWQTLNTQSKNILPVECWYYKNSSQLNLVCIHSRFSDKTSLTWSTVQTGQRVLVFNHGRWCWFEEWFWIVGPFTALLRTLISLSHALTHKFPASQRSVFWSVVSAGGWWGSNPGPPPWPLPRIVAASIS